MRAATLAAGVIAVVLLGAGVASATSGAQPRVTLIGDSIAESLDYVPSARRYLGRGLDLRSDTAACRRLVAASCAFQGAEPRTALDLIRSHGSSLGSVVVVDVGYNDWTAVYDVDRVMRALEAARVRTVVWVTLRETTSNYARSNARIMKATRRWRGLVVADWNDYSRGKPWFRSDGLHLTAAGAAGLSRLLRPLVTNAIKRF
ncbi:MAG: hypothetical protein ACRDOF_07885 [Gaiellaceae bacterium]